MDAATSPIVQLDEIVRASRRFRMKAEFDLGPTRRLRTSVSSRSVDGAPHWSLSMDVVTMRNSSERVVDVADVGDAMRRVASSYPKATIQPDTIEVIIVKGSTTASKLRPVVLRAWHEALGLPAPPSEEPAAPGKARDLARARKAARAELLALLIAGPEGIRDFNRRPPEERRDLDLRKADLAGGRLNGVQFNGANLDGVDLSGASLARAIFWGTGLPCRLKRARLVNADLRSASMPCCQGSDANFSGAILTDADLASSTFRRTKFVGADLSRAILTGSDLRGADFTGANLDGLILKGGEFDEATRWPTGYLPPSGVSWKGAGPDSRLAVSKVGNVALPAADLPGLIKRLKGSTDPAKLDKALTMLRADRFQLFARVGDDHLVGVVRSQSDATLVYACRLAADGRYACCTQNLNVCGGLRGSPCKHLLVLIVGLARAGQLDPGTALAYIRTSRGRKPELDRDAMTEVVLRYKGAASGELDWRPTETIPEDFYAM